MLFRKKKVEADTKPHQEYIKYGEYTEDEIANILRSYGDNWYKELTSTDNTRADIARQRIKRAEDLVGTSGVGAALAPTLVEHIMHWHAWISRDDFTKYVGFPASDISASEIVDLEGVRFAESVSFTYGTNTYHIMVLIDENNSWDEDTINNHGRVTVYIDDVEVIGLDMSLRLDQEYAVWRWERVFAFLPGMWMKDFIQIGAHIEASRVNETHRIVEEDLLKRSGKIDFI